jgi:hypothetical protein
VKTTGKKVAFEIGALSKEKVAKVQEAILQALAD